LSNFSFVLDTSLFTWNMLGLGKTFLKQAGG
jgi:hypothetical protein